MTTQSSPSLTLLTDLYQLTMAYGYWRTGTGDQEAVFHLFFRKPPFGGQYALAAGLAAVLDYLREFRFHPAELEYLATLDGNDGQPLFAPEFLDYLGQLRLSCDVHAVPEGTAVFAHQPLLRVQGPLLQGQLLETALLNLINFPTLIATKAARVCLAAEGDPVLEFGLRRAQGVDGALTASRAAYLGGCAATSNVLAGQRFGIPVKGTHAHSWVMSFASEPQAFAAYAQAMPNNCVFLVDTYDTEQGVRHAIAAGQALRAHGHVLAGIRLDSGDLAQLSIQARHMLDQAGFTGAAIVASNDLNEFLIQECKRQGARISVWGVGTKLACAYEQPALGGVYKLAAIRDADSAWQYKLKLSNEPAKISNPGILQIRRFGTQLGGFVGDMLFDELAPPADAAIMVDLRGETALTWPAHTPSTDLLVPVLRQGKEVYTLPPLAESREHARQQLAALPAEVTRLDQPEPYPMGLEAGLHARKLEMVARLRK